MNQHISPELARRDPEAFRHGIVEYMGNTTELGAQAWNLGVAMGAVDWSQFELRSGSWISHSNAAGRLILGTEPMSDRQKNNIIFGGERLSYAGEVSRRLVHELGHGVFTLAQRDPNMRQLGKISMDVRRQEQDQLGLSALGSLSFYETTHAKSLEDTVELLTMRMIGQSHFDSYMNFLQNPRHEALRQSLGIITLGNADLVSETVDKALVEAFSKAQPRRIYDHLINNPM